MKINVLNTLLFACMAAGFGSCEYQLDSENFREITPDSTQMIQVSLSPFETQYLFTVPTQVNYDLNTFGLKVYNVEFFVGEQLIHSGNEAVGAFLFEPSPWGIGTQEMSMVVTTGTNSGSLADLLEAEGFLFQQKWEVLLDGVAPNPVEITDIYNNGGVLKIGWEEYERLNFEKYVLYRNFGDAEGASFGHVIAEITDPAQHAWEDSSFIGGTGIYWVEVYGSAQKAGSQKQRFDFPWPALETLWVKADSASFRWTKDAFYGAVDQVAVTTDDHYPQPDITLFSSDNVNDTACVVKGLRFGNSANYTLSVYPKTNIPIYQDNQVLRSSVSFGIGNKLVRFDEFAGDPVNDRFYVSGDDEIYRYSYPGIEKQDSCESDYFPYWFVSLYDQKLVTQINSTMTMYSPDDLQNPVSYSSYDFGFNGFWTDFTISANNRMVGPVGFSAGLYDWNSSEMVFSSDNEELDWSILSPDGNYVFTRNYRDNNQTEVKIWRITTTGFELTGLLPQANYSYLGWAPGNGHRLAALKGYQSNTAGVSENRFAVYDAETAQPAAEFPVKVGYFSGMDPASKLVAFYSHVPGWDYTEYAYLYDYETGELARRVSLHPQINNLWFYRSHLFSSEGFCIDISVF